MSSNLGGAYQSEHDFRLGQPGDVVLLLDENGPYGSTPWYEISYSDAVKGLGPKGITVLWQAGTVPITGYGAAPSAGSGSIGANGGQIAGLTPAALNMGKNQLLQFRWKIEVGPVLASGIVVDDLDLLVNAPPAIAKNGSYSVQGRWNMTEQYPSPSDQTAGPAQAANKALPAAYPGIGPGEQFDPASELYCLEQKYQPAFTVINNGATGLVSGLVGIRIYGYRYDLRPITDTSDATDWMRKTRFGLSMPWPTAARTGGRAPAVVPITGRGSAAG